MDAYDHDHKNEGEEAQQVSDLEKTSLKNAISVFDRTFMKDLWTTIRLVPRKYCVEILLVALATLLNNSSAILKSL